ncbi:MAG: purine-nucleoside phosphorylase [Chloroflexi bacterium]|nr:purine-nucleoside phosphorylase [Chloroflexota bacterium]
MSDRTLWEQAQEAAAVVRSRCAVIPRIGIVLGSGLGPLAERISEPIIIPYDQLPHMPLSTVAGHSGRLLAGRLAGQDVLMMQGRVHYYEGYSPQQITLPIRMMQQLGVRVVIITNSAGGINKAFHTGDLMLITDHINFVGLAGAHPLRGPNDDRLGERFPDMSRAYDVELLELARRVGRQQGIRFREGVYAIVSGPSFETPAEIRMLRALGADAVGMSTVPEVVVARHGGIRVLGISLISNETVDSFEAAAQPSHAEVLEAGQASLPRLESLIEGVLQQLILN